MPCIDIHRSLDITRLLFRHPAQFTLPEMTAAVRGLIPLEVAYSSHTAQESADRIADVLLRSRQTSTAPDPADPGPLTRSSGPASAYVSDDALIAQYEPHIRTVVASLRRGNRHLTIEDGEEIAQASRYALSRVPQTHRSHPKYCRTVCNNAARQARKAILRYSDRHISADLGWEQGFCPLASLLSVDPTDATDTAQTAAKLWSELTPRQQSILSMHLGLHAPRLGYKQIAYAMGTPERRIRHEIKVAMTRLREMAGPPEK